MIIFLCLWAKSILHFYYGVYVHYAVLSDCSGVHFLVPMSRGAVIDFVVTYILAVQVSVHV